MIRRPPRSTRVRSSAASDVYKRQIITRALGPEPEVDVDVQTAPAAPGDVFLLCSDGLTTMVGEERIAATLSHAGSLREAVRTLVEEANRAGGRDNITALAFRLEDAAAPRRGGALEPEGERRDVVAPAGAVGLLDQRAHGLAQRAGVAQGGGDALLADHRRQAVGAEQEDVAGGGRGGLHVDVDLRFGPERTGDDRALRVLLRLRVGDLAFAPHLLDQRVVAGQPLELAAAQAE